MKKEAFLQVLFFLLLFLAFYLLFKITVPFLSALFWAVVFVVAFHPVNNLLRRVFGQRRSIAASLCTLAVILLIIVPLAFLVKVLGKELSDAYKALEEAISQGHLERLLDRLEQMGIVQRIVGLLSEGPEKPDLEEVLLRQARQASLLLASQSAVLLRKLSSALLQFLIMAVALFYLFRDGDLLIERLKALLPLSREEGEELLNRVHRMILATLYGGVLVAMIQGGLGGVGFWIVGLPSPVLWGLVMAALSLLPIVGAYLVWVPAVLWLFFAQGEVTKALFLLGWGLLIVSTVDNLLRPIFIGERTKVHPLLLFFAILGGIKAFGLLGIVAAPVIVAFALAMLDFYTKPRPPSQPGTE